MKNIMYFSVLFFTVVLIPMLVFGQTLNLEYSTYLGGSKWEYGYGISVGTNGKAYVTGWTSSFDFPTENSYQVVHSGGSPHDIFVSALSSTGSALLYSTYLGGSRYDDGYGISVGTDEKAYVTGWTESLDFPTVNPYQAVYGGYTDAFVAALSSSGSSLFYSTYLGGSGHDEGYGISVGTDGRAYVTGGTESFDFPTENSYQDTYGGYGCYAGDAFVTTLSSTGSVLSYSTYLGGDNGDEGYGISVGMDGRAYITGWTTSLDFPTENPYQAGLGEAYDAFVTALTSTGSALFYSTYLGGGYHDSGEGISLGTDEKAYISGITQSVDFPTVNPYQGGKIEGYYAGVADAFVTALTSTGSALFYSTYLGGSSIDGSKGISVGTDERAYITGCTDSPDFPTRNSYQAANGGSRDAFVAALSSTGSALFFSTFLGGSGLDWGYGISMDPAGRAYVFGRTESLDFPTVNPYQAGCAGDSDVFVSKLTLLSPLPWIYDYNGDGISDVAIFRPTESLWDIRGVTRIYFGDATDETVPGDYDGDGTTEIGIYRNNSGLWAIRGVTRIYFGSSLDLPESGDYNGDGTSDIGIFRNTSGLWAIRGITRVYFGSLEDSPVSGYYDGDTTRDIGIFRGSSGLWAIRGITRVYFGLFSNTIVPGDYDGDGTWDYGIFRNSSGLWAVRGITRCYFGSSIDKSIPADYIGDSKDDIGIFRETSGLWTIRNISRIYFGKAGDIPVTR